MSINACVLMMICYRALPRASQLRASLGEEVGGQRHLRRRQRLQGVRAEVSPELPPVDALPHEAHERREPGGGDDELEAGGRRHGGKPRGPRAGGVGDGASAGGMRRRVVTFELWTDSEVK